GCGQGSRFSKLPSWHTPCLRQPGTAVLEYQAKRASLVRAMPGSLARPAGSPPGSDRALSEPTASVMLCVSYLQVLFFCTGPEFQQDRLSCCIAWNSGFSKLAC
ncbi:hypothetical protein DUNSADRAFT_2304, partial [Dunaliella salina]